MLCDAVVETFLPEYGFGAMFEHQLRWARTIRDLRKCGYIGVLLTFGLPWAMAAALCAGGAAWSLVLLGVVAAARFASGYVLCGPILNDRQTLGDLVADSGARCGGSCDLVRQLWRRHDRLARGAFPSEGWTADKGVGFRPARKAQIPVRHLIDPTFANSGRMWATGNICFTLAGDGWRAGQIQFCRRG